MILVLGAGITGLSVANFLVNKGIKFVLADSREQLPFIDKFPNCIKFLGNWQQKSLNNITQIIISPGIAKSEKIVLWAQQKKIPIVSDIDLFYQYSNAKIIGITGTNGKSSVVKMLEHCLNLCGKKSIACGNIGLPVLDALNDEIEIYVVEMSSYQLDWSNKIKFDYATILNISPDHLDRYNDFSDYIKAKLKIYQLSKNNIINPNESWNKNIQGIKIKNIVANVKTTKLLGEHSLSNISSVITICKELGLSYDQSIAAISSFSPLPHRLEFVAKIDNCDYFNDSKATNSASTIVAIKAICKKYDNVILILGGVKKTEDYKDMLELINQKINIVILFGESIDFFAKHIIVKIKIANSFEDCVKISKTIIADCVLFSPACASFDTHSNFVKRGDDFKRHVKI